MTPAGLAGEYSKSLIGIKAGALKLSPWGVPFLPEYSSRCHIPAAALKEIDKFAVMLCDLRDGGFA